MQLEEIKRHLAARAALPEEERIFQDPPVLTITRRCICGRDVGPYICGWDEMVRAAEREEAIPTHMEVRKCSRCEPEEEENL